MRQDIAHENKVNILKRFIEHVNISKRIIHAKDYIELTREWSASRQFLFLE